VIGVYGLRQSYRLHSLAECLRLRSAGYHLALSYVEQGVKEVPPSARFFLIITTFFYSFWWLLAPAIVGVLLTVSILTSPSRQRL
jgi:hypothetical protein